MTSTQERVWFVTGASSGLAAERAVERFGRLDVVFKTPATATSARPRS